ncbi:deoxynucleoside kinase-like [Anthonomus grandis grandis]|uniref:deoxynucleoside kinase-like n=1 Tax=Anthonomus grandis grandis TaxID=2921223 RepID=UPI002166ADAB|nr:deoxynucleoside kinase-like [Anthonomus grandis grandis]
MQQVKHLITKMAGTAAQKINRPFTVIVEGNIGSGKTTFLQQIARNENVCVLAEPVDNWRDVNGHNLLGLMYEDPKKWSFTFQSYVQLTMLQNHLQQTGAPIKLIERSLYSARYCFVEKLAKDGLLPQPSFAVIDKWFSWIKSQKLAEVDMIVYLRTSPEVVYERILQRKRPEERTVSLEHLRSLNQYHEDWLFNKNKFECPAPTLVLNADQERETVAKEFLRLEPEILSTLNIKAEAHG